MESVENSPLRRVRKQEGMRLIDLSEVMEEQGENCTPAYLSLLERGKVWPRRPVVDALVGYFKGALTQTQILYPDHFTGNSKNVA